MILQLLRRGPVARLNVIVEQIESRQAVASHRAQFPTLALDLPRCAGGATDERRSVSVRELPLTGPADAHELRVRGERDAKVTLRFVDNAPTITRIDLDTTGVVPGIDAAEFQKLAEEAKAGCPVSRALGGVEITVNATLQ